MANRPRAPQIRFRYHEVVDEQQGGLLVGMFAVPSDWRSEAKVEWNYQNVSWPVRASMRAVAPDGSAWVQGFPAENFFWGENWRPQTPVGGQSLGMIHQPNVTLQQAMQRFVIARYRGKQPGLEIVGYRAVRDLPQALGQPPIAGEAIAVRIRYRSGEEVVDEEFYAHMTEAVRDSYAGPQGTWHGRNRVLLYVHSMGAKNGKLESLYPLLGFIASSWRGDPAYQAHVQRVRQQINEQFNQYIARGYAQIQAAAQLSRTISANNDAMLASMQAQRQAQAQRDAARRAASAARDPSDAFSLYMRGTERMKDPYRGESEQSYHHRYHWTDGHGNYRHSNDSGYNPNIGAGGGPTWQRMEPAGR